MSCLICLEHLNEGQFITTNYCSCLQHVHQKCFEDWIDYNNIVKCIICKKTERILNIQYIQYILNILFDFIFCKLYILYILSYSNIPILLILYITLITFFKVIYKIKRKLFKSYKIHN